MNKIELLSTINSIGNASCDLGNSCDTEVERLLVDPWLDKLNIIEKSLTQVYENLLLQEAGVTKEVDIPIFLNQTKSYRETIKEAVTEGLGMLVEEEKSKKRKTK